MDKKKEDKMKTVEDQLTYAKDLIRKGLLSDVEVARVILLKLTQQKRGISTKQKTEVATLLAPLLEEKMKEIEEAMEKLRSGIENDYTSRSTEAISFLMHNAMYLTEEEDEEITMLFAKFLKNART